MVMHLLQVVVSNIFADLDDNSGSNLFLLSTDPTGATSWSPSKSSSSSNQAPQLQSSAVVSSERYGRRLMAPLCVKIAALETLELLLNVGGSFRACFWRTEMDLLLINVARESCYKVGMYDQRPPSTEDPSVPDFQLASLKSLLASFLSCRHERPPYLVQGLELFNRGKLETGTELAKFCSHALLALDVLVHPRGLCLQYDSKRVLPQERAAHGGVGSISGLDSGRSKPPRSVRKRRTTNNLGDEVSNWLLCIDDEPTDAYVKETSLEKHAATKLSRDPEVQKDTIIAEHQEIVLYRLPGPVQHVTTSIRTDVEIAVAGTKEREGSCLYAAEFDTMGNPPGSVNVDSAPVTLPDPRNPGDASISNEKCGDQTGIVSGDASSSKNVPGHNSPIFDAPSVFGSEWDSLDPFLDIGDFCPDCFFPRHG